MYARVRMLCGILLMVVMLISVLTAMPLAVTAQPGDNGGPGNSGAAKLCQKGGWATLARQEDLYTPFSSQGDCVSHGAQGGSFGDLVYVEVTWGPFEGGVCGMTWRLHNFHGTGTVDVKQYHNDGHLFVGLSSGDPVHTMEPIVSQGSVIETVTAEVLSTGEFLHVSFPTTACGE